MLKDVVQAEGYQSDGRPTAMVQSWIVINKEYSLPS